MVSGYIYINELAHVQFCSSHDNCAALFLFMAFSKRDIKIVKGNKSKGSK